jgi:hypothetical protein
MPADVEKCVKKIKGTNKRTGKPYTQSEKWAICQSMHNKKKNASFEEEEIVVDEEIAAEVENKMADCMRRMMDSGKAKNDADARSMCEAMMSKSNYDMKNFELIFSKEL